jgi:hypothetical protein
VPWEEWGPQAASIERPGWFFWITRQAGQRRFTFDRDGLVIHDFSATRIRRARARSRRAHVSANTCEERNDHEEASAAAVTEIVIQGGLESCFKDDVVSLLPFLETRVAVRKGSYDDILTDGEGLVVIVHRVSRTSAFF